MTAGPFTPTPSHRARTAEHIAQAVRAGSVRDDRLCSIVSAVHQTLGTERVQISMISDRQISLAYNGMSVAECAASADPLAGLVVPVEDGLCGVAIRSDAQLCIDDAALDERVASSPGVVGGFIGSYLGSPIRIPDGPREHRHGEITVGVLCTSDSAAHEWTFDQRAALDRAATEVASELSRIRDALEGDES